MRTSPALPTGWCEWSSHGSPPLQCGPICCRSCGTSRSTALLRRRLDRLVLPHRKEDAGNRPELSGTPVLTASERVPHSIGRRDAASPSPSGSRRPLASSVLVRELRCLRASRTPCQLCPGSTSASRRCSAEALGAIRTAPSCSPALDSAGCCNNSTRRSSCSLSPA